MLNVKKTDKIAQKYVMFFFKQNISVDQCNMNDTSKHFDVVIIGGGAVGLSIVSELVQESLKIALVSPQNSSGVASLAAGAMVDAFGEMPNDLTSEYERHKLMAEVKAQRIFPEWLQSIYDRSGRNVFHRMGLFIVSNRDGSSDRARMKLIEEQLIAFGEDFEWVEPDEVPGLKPNYRYPAHNALFVKGALSVDTTELLPALEAVIEQSGRCVRVDDTATDVEQQGSTWRVHTHNSGTIVGERLVVCAGAHTLKVIGEALRQKAKLPQLYFGQGTSCTVTGAPEIPHTIRTPNRALACGVHIVPRARQRVYLGATNWFGTNFNNPKGIHLGQVHSLLDVVMNQINTALRSTSIESLSWGLRPVTAFDRPIVGETEIPGLFVATGTHRTGVHLSPLLAKFVSAELLGKKQPDENPFSPKKSPEIPSERNIALGIRGVLSAVLEPGGELPYNSFAELEIFMTELFKLAVCDDADEDLRHQLRHLLQEIPLDEQSVLCIFNEVMKRSLPEDKLYMS
jgi:glycine oxidase